MKLRLTIAVLLVLIFGLVTIPTFFIRSVVKTYLNPGFYEGPVVEESYEYLLSFLQKQVENDEFVAEYFDASDVEQFTREYFAIDSLKEITQDFVSQMNNLTEGRSSNEIDISLLPLKQRIPDMAADLSVLIIEKIPYCEDQIDEETIEEFAFDNELPPCIPRGLDKDSLENPLAREIEKNLNDTIPGEFKLNLENGNSKEGAEFKQLLFIFKYAQMILPLFMLIMLLLQALIIYKPYTRVMKFIGASFVLGGVLALVSGQLLAQVPGSAINAQNFPDLLATDISEMVSFYSFLIQFIVDRISVYSVYFIGIGVLVILVGAYLSHFYEKHPHVND
ncbi:hypothetical protein ACFL10_02360 [Patescibacteria group bacterium]